MKLITMHPSPYSVFSIPFVGIHPIYGLAVRSDGFVLCKNGSWSPGHDHRAKKSTLTYKRFDIHSRNPQIRSMVHVLVAETFLANPDNKPTVDHIDRNTLNNDISNLRYASYKEQALNTASHLNAPPERERQERKREYHRMYYKRHADKYKYKLRSRLRYMRIKDSSMPVAVIEPQTSADEYGQYKQ